MQQRYNHSSYCGASIISKEAAQRIFELKDGFKSDGMFHGIVDDIKQLWNGTEPFIVALISECRRCHPESLWTIKRVCIE
jgi:hypothetical protein